MSADSGVPTYRDDRGMWRDFPGFAERGIQPQDIAHLDGYRRDPHAAWGFHEHVRRIMANAVPHAGYEVLARWMRETWPDAFLLTTNVDGLHRRSGVEAHRMWERYGNIFVLQCVAACRPIAWPEPRAPLHAIDAETLRAADLPCCPFCGGPARPSVQLDHDEHFLQDEVAAHRYQRFVDDRVIDVYVVVGTTLWFSWPDGVPQPAIININPDPATHARYVDPIAITMGACDALVGIDWMLRRLR
jgi:NAD-dependent SIR2 family protein deacetylase